MLKRKIKWRRFGLRSLFLLTFAAAVFCAGYRIGFDHGRNARFDNLIELITNTNIPDKWDEVGGPGSVSAFEGKFITTTTGCEFVSEQPSNDLNNPFAIEDSDDNTFDESDSFR